LIRPTVADRRTGHFGIEVAVIYFGGNIEVLEVANETTTGDGHEHAVDPPLIGKAGYQGADPDINFGAHDRAKGVAITKIGGIVFEEVAFKTNIVFGGLDDLAVFIEQHGFNRARLCGGLAQVDGGFEQYFVV
jgi:hypothetical protein